MISRQSAPTEFHQLPPGSQDDKELTLAFKAGEKGAYQVIYDRYSPRVHGVCRRMLGHPDDAQEASQEAFLRVYQALGKFNGRYQLGPWITRIATNVCLDHIRSKSRRPVPASIELADLDPMETTPDFDPEMLVIRRSESRRVRKVLESLPPMHRAAIVLRDFEGLTYEEVSVALGITDCQTKALLHRARRGFKRAWSNTGVAALLPWRLVDRFRRPDAALRHQGHTATSVSQVAEAATPAAHSLASCGAVLQQCGQFMAERLAPMITALVLGTATVGAAASPSAPAPPQISRPIADDLRPVATGSSIARRKSTRPRPVAAAPSPEAPTPTAPEPTAEPEPTAPAGEPTGSEEPKDGGGPEESGEFQPVVETSVALSFQGYERAPMAPISQQSSVDCSTATLNQSLTSEITDEDGAHPIALELSTEGSIGLTLTITKDGRDFTYNGGAATMTYSKSAQELEMSFSGSYSRIGNNQPASANLPESGRFDAKLSVDCAASRVITEVITLSVR